MKSRNNLVGWDTGMPADATVGSSPENEWQNEKIEILFVGLVRGTSL